MMDFSECSLKALLLVSLLTGKLVTVLSHGDDDEEHSYLNKNEHPKLLVISFDGFRYDFLDMYQPPTLLKLAAQGVHAQSLTSSYITKTFPNHYTISTGLHEESHGIVSNRMHDPVWNEDFNSCSDVSCGKWYGGEPIWNSNELNNKMAHVVDHVTTNGNSTRFRRHGGEPHKKMTPYASGSMYWPGASAAINNRNITFSKNYVNASHGEYLNFTERIDEVISWFTHPETPINLAMLYNEYPDQDCHKYGPKSPEVEKDVLQIDNDIKYLLGELEEHGLSDVNIILLSDHGFAAVDGFVYFGHCIANGTYDVTNNSPMFNIWPINDSPELKAELYKNLSECEGITAHTNDSQELRDYFYSYNKRISPIVIMSAIPEGDEPAKLLLQFNTSTDWHPKGNHGWNNTWYKMHALFIAYGPAFKSGHVHDPFLNVNIYPLMCEVLGIDCAPSNGSLSVVCDMLYDCNDMITMQTVVAVSVVLALIAGIMVIGAGKLGCGSSSIRTTGQIRSYSVQLNGKKGFERATLLESSDEEF